VPPWVLNRISHDHLA